MTLLAGIDGGGSTCKVALVDQGGRLLARADAGPANVMTDLQGAARNIIASVTDALTRAGMSSDRLPEISAALGVAGGNVGDYAARLPALLPFRDCVIETDAHISLRGAFGDEDGAVAALGTGTIFIYRIHGAVHLCGGWGFDVGDQCSGARLGKTLLEQTLLAYDTVTAGSDLTRRVLDRFDNDPQGIVEYAHTAQPVDYGVFSPWIFEAHDEGDPVARRIVRDSVDDLEGILDTILSGNTLPLCMLGGLGQSYAKLLDDRLRKRQRRPKADALAGAVDLALSTFAAPERALA